MTDDTRASYLILANSLRDTLFHLEENIRAKRKFTWVQTAQGDLVAELAPLLSVIMLLERLGQLPATPDSQPLPLTDFGTAPPGT